MTAACTTLLLLGRLAESVPRRSLDGVLVAPHHLAAAPGVADGMLVVGLDARDEQHLADVERAVARWRKQDAGPVAVAVVGRSDLSTRQRSSQLARWARTWHACVVDIPFSGQPDSMAQLAAMFATGSSAGLIGLDPFDLAHLFASPAVGSLHVESYDPRSVDWKVTADLGSALATSTKVFAAIECTLATSLSTINDLCQALFDASPADAMFLVSCPVTAVPRLSVLAFSAM